MRTVPQAMYASIRAPLLGKDDWYIIHQLEMDAMEVVIDDSGTYSGTVSLEIPPNTKRYLCAGDAVATIVRDGSGAVVCRRKSDPELDGNREVLE